MGFSCANLDDRLTFVKRNFHGFVEIENFGRARREAALAEVVESHRVKLAAFFKVKRMVVPTRDINNIPVWSSETHSRFVIKFYSD